METESKPAAASAALQPRVVHPDQADRLRPFGIDMRVLLAAEQTGGSFSALIADVRPGEGPPLHLHRGHDEYFFVLEGTYQLQVGDQEQTIGPGTLAFVPRGTAHGFKNIGGSDGRLLEWTIPGDNEAYFRAVDAMESAGGFDPAQFAEINRRFATEFVGP